MMVLGILAYCFRRLLIRVEFLRQLAGRLMRMLGCGLLSRFPSVDYYAHNDYLFRLIVKRVNYGFDMMVWTIRFMKFLGFRVVIHIHVNRFNYFYIPEMVDHCLSLKGLPLIDRHRFYDKDRSFWCGYLRFIDNLNKHLASFDINISIEGNDEPLIAGICHAIDRKITDDPDSWGSFNKKVMILEDSKKFSPSRAGRYLSLLAEEVMVGPEIVVMDIYHKCNTDCLHCWMHSPKARKLLTPEFLSQKMDFERMRGIVDDCARMGVDAITLLGDGEPVLNPDFLKILWHIKNANSNINVMTFSNGLAVTPGMSHELVSAGLNEIWFSVPAATGETYEKVCPSKKASDFKKVQQNIAYLCRFKKILKRLHQGWDVVRGKKALKTVDRKNCFSPYCIIAYVLHAENYHEILPMAKMAVELGVDEMRFQLIHLDKDNKHLQLSQEQIDFLNEKLPEVKLVAEQGGVALSSALKFQLTNMAVSTGDWSKGYYLKHGCPIGFFFSIIKANGDVGLCCGLKVIDNLNQRSFYDIWMSSGYRQARIGAKHLSSNKDMSFQKTDYHKDEKRGDLLYSERCEYCDNHDLNNEYINGLMHKGFFDRFMKN
ncbi:MAG: radical SAM protein [Candidatus Omnitrophota bacterium]